MHAGNAAVDRPSPRASERLFTVETANVALVYVRRIVSDIVEQYAELTTLRAERNDLLVAQAQESSPELDELAARIDGLAASLNQLFAELAEVGCDLKDWARGLVDFPAMYQGRKVWLCWRLGEEQVTHWHEWHAGFTGRQPLPQDFA